MIALDFDDPVFQRPASAATFLQRCRQLFERVFGQWQIQDEMLEDRLKLHETCNELNLNMNCVKTGVAGSTLVVTGEHLMTPGADLSTLVQVSIQVILSGVHIWHQRMLGLDPNIDGDTPTGGPQ